MNKITIYLGDSEILLKCITGDFIEGKDLYEICPVYRLESYVNEEGNLVHEILIENFFDSYDTFRERSEFDYESENPDEDYSYYSIMREEVLKSTSNFIKQLIESSMYDRDKEIKSISHHYYLEPEYGIIAGTIKISIVLDRSVRTRVEF